MVQVEKHITYIGMARHLTAPDINNDSVKIMIGFAHTFWICSGKKPVIKYYAAAEVGRKASAYLLPSGHPSQLHHKM